MAKVRVGFMGTHSTGKTTTVDEIFATKLLPRPVFVQSTSRDVGAAGYGINETASPLSQALVTMGRVVKEDTIYDGDYSHIISDRTPLDSLAYTMWSARNTWGMEPNDIYLQYSTGLVVNHMKKYDHVFYFPIHWGLVSDGVRSESERYRVEIDGLVKSLANYHGVRYHTVPNVGPQAMAGFVIDRIA